ncbi:MAG: cyclic-di-AMP receptor [Caldilineaceae bacterium]
MKMVMAIINNEDSRNVIDRLSRRGFSVTMLNSSGGFLRVGNTTLLCGVEDEKVVDVLDVIRESCPTRIQYVTPLPPVMEPGEVNIPRPVEKHVGGATIFVFPVEHFERI